MKSLLVLSLLALSLSTGNMKYFSFLQSQAVLTANQPATQTPPQTPPQDATHPPVTPAADNQKPKHKINPLKTLLFGSNSANDCPLPNRRVIWHGNKLVYKMEPKEDWFTLKQYGRGPAGMVFDYLDPLLRAQVVQSLKDYYNDVRTISKEKIKELPIDPYNLVKQVSPSLPEDKIPKIKEEIETFNWLDLFSKKFPSIDMTLYKDCLPFNYILAAASEWKWDVPSDPEAAYTEMASFDFQGMGRLCRREFYAYMIQKNKKILGAQSCKNCFNNLNNLYLTPLFSQMNCTEIGSITVEKMMYVLDNLQGASAEHNIFNCGTKGYTQCNSKAFNDFVLKNSSPEDPGKLSRYQWITAIVRGYVDRHVLPQKINDYADENEQKKRWHKL